MDVFVSWSGARSGAAAQALHAWLPKIINDIKPWLSSADIDKGARWGSDIAVKLESAKAGIICLTKSNLSSDWILFEAGALSKTIQNTFVCPLLIDLQPTDIRGPLAQFQATRVTKSDMLRLLKTLNSGLEEKALSDSHIEEAFEVWWPKLEGQLKSLPTEPNAGPPTRTDRDVLEEILALVRNQNRGSSPGLADDDLIQIFQARAWRALRSVHGAIGGSYVAPAIVGNNLVWEVNTTIKGTSRKYQFNVPLNLTPEEMEAKALAQIKEADKLEAEARKSTHEDTVPKVDS